MSIINNMMKPRQLRVALATLGLLSLSMVESNVLAAETGESAANGENVGSYHSASPGAHGDSDPHKYLAPKQHIAVAQQHFQEGRVTLALETLEKALEQYPENVELLGSKAGVQFQLGKTADALGSLERALSIEPGNAMLLVSRAQAYRRFERTSEALDDLDLAIRNQPDYLPARFNRGSVLLEQGNAEEAIAEFEHCIRIDPHLPAPWFNRASAYHQSGDTQAAIADLERFLQISKNEQWNETARELLASWGKVEMPASANADADS